MGAVLSRGPSAPALQERSWCVANRAAASACGILLTSCSFLLALPSDQCQTSADCAQFRTVCDVVQHLCVVLPSESARGPDAGTPGNDSQASAGTGGSSGPLGDGRPIDHGGAASAEAGDREATDAGGGDETTDTSGEVDNASCVVGAAACGVDDDGGVDVCPADPTKTAPGACGCGTADTDTDGDAMPDCLDGCPSDPDKVDSGVCGCGHHEPPGGVEPAFCFREAIVHRYRFEETGTVVTDSIGDADGARVGAARASSGSVELSGDLDTTRYAGEGYVALPSRVLSGLLNATFEAWITWDGAGPVGRSVWQRIFDFGDQTGTGVNAAGRTSLYLTPSSERAGGDMRATFGLTGAVNETFVDASTGPLPSGGLEHVAVVVDEMASRLALYLDGAPVGSVALSSSLSSINDVNSWLGRSQYAGDPEFHGRVHEFRIYNVALRASQVAASFAAGADPSYLP
jgi:hypothetical protein